MKRLASFVLVLALAGSGCATALPAGTYTAPVLAQYNATPLQQSILALSQTAVAMNAATGPTHLKDADTALVRDFALSSSAAIDAYVAGNGTLVTVRTGFDILLRGLSADAKDVTLKASLASLQVLVDGIAQGAL